MPRGCVGRPLRRYLAMRTGRIPPVMRHLALKAERWSPPYAYVGMRTAFPGLAVGLQAVIHVMQQSSHCHMANSVSHPVQFIRQVAGTLAGPEQGRLWVTSSRRFQQDGQVMAQGRVTLFDRMPPTADPTNAFGWPVLGGGSGRAVVILVCRPTASSVRMSPWPQRRGRNPPRENSSPPQAAHCRRMRSFASGLNRFILCVG